MMKNYKPQSKQLSELQAEPWNILHQNILIKNCSKPGIEEQKLKSSQSISHVLQRSKFKKDGRFVIRDSTSERTVEQHLTENSARSCQHLDAAEFLKKKRLCCTQTKAKARHDVLKFFKHKDNGNRGKHGSTQRNESCQKRQLHWQHFSTEISSRSNWLTKNNSNMPWGL